MLGAKYDALRTVLDERTRRLWAGTEAYAWGRGGIAAVRRVTGLTIHVCHLPPGTSKWNKDRASPVLVHQPELAGSAAADPCHDRQPDLPHAHVDRPEGSLRARHEALSPQGHHQR